jgi:hypothetical protein
VIGDHHISIDHDPTGALADLYDAYRENPISKLPQLSPSPRTTATPAPARNGEWFTIARYNETHDVEDLIQFYGAKPTRRHRLYFCPFHEDEHASLGVYTCEGQRYCHCFSVHSDCPLAKHGRNDAFNVYCIGEGLDAKEALRRLNRRV